MDIFNTFKQALSLFKKTFIPLFMVTAVLPVINMIIQPSLDNYLVFKTITLFDLISFITALLWVAVGFIILDTYYKAESVNLQTIFAKAFDVVWPLFLFELIWMGFGALFGLLALLPGILILVAFLGVIYLSVRLSITVVLIIVEKESVAKAFDRSFVLTKGKFWSMFAVYILNGLIITVMMAVFLATYLDPGYGSNYAEIFSNTLANSTQFQFLFYVVIATIASQLIYSTLYMVYQTLIHIDSIALDSSAEADDAPQEMSV